MSSKVCYDHLGNRYNSIEEMCQAYSINKETFYTRTTKGWSIEDALTKPIKKMHMGAIKYRGITYSNFTELCESFNMKPTVVQQRIKLGWTLDRALNTATRAQNSNLKNIVEYKGIKYGSFSELCKAYNKPMTTVKYRILNGSSLEDALESEAKRSVKPIDHRGIEYDSFQNMCKAYNKNGSMVRNRLNRGWSLKDALEGRAIQSNKKIHDGIGNTFESINELARFYNNYKKLSRRIMGGWDIIIAAIVNDKINLKFIGLDNKSYYSVPWSNAHVTAREIIQHYRPDLIDLYDKYNPTGEYNPYRG